MALTILGCIRCSYSATEMLIFVTGRDLKPQVGAPGESRTSAVFSYRPWGGPSTYFKNVN